MLFQVHQPIPSGSEGSFSFFVATQIQYVDQKNQTVAIFDYEPMPPEYSGRLSLHESISLDQRHSMESTSFLESFDKKKRCWLVGDEFGLVIPISIDSICLY